MSREQTLLITGATGTLGRAFSRIAVTRGLPHRLTSRQDLDLRRGDSIEAFIEAVDPWAVINTAGFVRVDEAERDNDSCFAANCLGNVMIAQSCARRGIPLVAFSSDLVFDGTKSQPYTETDAPNPLACYGRCKAASERLVVSVQPLSLIIRTSAFFGPWDDYNFVSATRQALEMGLQVTADSKWIVSPTYVPDLVNATLDLLIDGERGIWHLANTGEISWEGLARLVARHIGADSSLVRGVAVAEMGYCAPRPPYSALSSERGQVMPSLDDALDRYFAHAAASTSYRE